MTYVITEPCIGNKEASCVAVCPVDCIHPTQEEAEFHNAEMLYIDPAACIDCGVCVDECPVSAIYPENALPDQWTSFIRRNAVYYARRRPPA